MSDRRKHRDVTIELFQPCHALRPGLRIQRVVKSSRGAADFHQELGKQALAETLATKITCLGCRAGKSIYRGRYAELLRRAMLRKTAS